MASRSDSRSAVLQWVVVLVVGILVVTLVLGLNLISRLDDGQKVLNAAQPAFTQARVAGDRAGINIISDDVNMADPIVTPQGGAAAEVPQLVAFVAHKTGLSQQQVLTALQKNFPHVTSQAQLLAALTTSFPALAQAITNLPTVTSGWEHIQDIDGLTRFNGSAVQSVPQLRTYFSSDLIPVLETQRTNFASLDGTSSLNWIAPLLLIVGFVVIAFALLMIALHLRGPVSRAVAMGSSSVVLIVGVGVVVLVLALSLVPRVTNGQKLLDALGPVNVPARIHGDRAGINMVSAITDMEDPIMTPQGGAAAEVPQLVAFVAHKTGLSQQQVLTALQKNFPHVT
ncbi:MAG: hypothetical protein ABSD82_15050, partial [Solirubrobacteraceae bacterium]